MHLVTNVRIQSFWGKDKVREQKIYNARFDLALTQQKNRGAEELAKPFSIFTCSL
jgi:hypothetical protein